MIRRLFVVEDVFDIPARGLILVPGVPASLTPPLRRGARLELRTPDGFRRRTAVHSFELVLATPPIQSVAILLTPGLKKEEIPLGTEVWEAE